MSIRLIQTLAMAGVVFATLAASAFSQETPAKGKGKMSEKEQMAMVDKMSTGEKAGIVGRMSMKDMTALKIAGMETHHTTEQEHTAKMEKMTEQEKSDLFDKLPMAKRMSLMRKEHMEKTPKK